MNDTSTTLPYPPPPPELIDGIRQRLAQVPADVMQRVHHAFMHKPIQDPGSLLWKAGVCLSSHELYEYRKTLFPPNALVDPDTQRAPVLRPEFANCSILQDHSSPHPAAAANPEPGIANPEPASLLTDLRDVIQRYVVLPDLAAETLALWVVHTYAFMLRQVTTYVGVVSPEKRCGKTTLLELLGLLANRSLTAANISPSALFRVIEDTKPTLLIDEADTFLQGRDELAGILNAGYRKGNSYVVRVADRKARPGRASYTSPTNAGESAGRTSYTSPPNGECTSDQHTNPGRTSYTSPHSDPHPTPEFGAWTNDRPDGSPGSTEFAQYSCWCPKVMAAIGRLPDTLADRCIIITMQRKLPGEKCERLRQLNAPAYRKRCADFVRAHSGKIAHAQPEIPSTLNDRAADIWEPLLAIADLAGGEWPQLARAAARQLSASDDEITLVGYFLKDLRNFMVLTKVDRMLSRDIVATFNPVHDRPWEDLRRGREINEWWLGRLLAGLGLRSRTMRANDAMGKGYALADLDAAFRRYVPNPEAHTVQLPMRNPHAHPVELPLEIPTPGP